MLKFLKNKNVSLAFLLIILALPAIAQSPLLEEEPINPENLKYGPNRKNYTSSYFSVGFGHGEAPETYSNAGHFNIAIGGRFKRKIAKHNALVFDLGYQYQEWKYFANENTPLPSTEFSSLRLRKNKLHLLETSAALRFQFYRGNIIGPYLDIGAGAWLNLFGTQKYKGNDSLDNAISFNQSGWKTDNAFAAYGLLRLNLWAVSVFWKQRFTPWLKSNDLPTSTFGIELNL